MTISSQPLLVARDRLALSDKVTAYIAQARRVTADGITFGELVELIVAAMRLAIAAVDELGSCPWTCGIALGFVHSHLLNL